jgi:hypothetical protein
MSVWNFWHKWSARLLLVIGIVEGFIPNISISIYFLVPAVIIVLVYVPVAVLHEVIRARAEEIV